MKEIKESICKEHNHPKIMCIECITCEKHDTTQAECKYCVEEAEDKGRADLKLELITKIRARIHHGEDKAIGILNWLKELDLND